LAGITIFGMECLTKYVSKSDPISHFGVIPREYDLTRNIKRLGSVPN